MKCATSLAGGDGKRSTKDPHQIGNRGFILKSCRFYLCNIFYHPYKEALFEIEQVQTGISPHRQRKKPETQNCGLPPLRVQNYQHNTGSE
jgi:hypothetical protein